VRFQILEKILTSVRTGSNMKARMSQHVYGGSQSLSIAPASYPSSGRFTAAGSGTGCPSSHTQRGRTFRAVEAGGVRGRANLLSGSGIRDPGFGFRDPCFGFRVSGFVLGIPRLMHLPLRCSRSLIVQIPSPFVTAPVLPKAFRRHRPVLYKINTQKE
jgi:hypothetical protein